MSYLKRKQEMGSEQARVSLMIGKARELWQEGEWWMALSKLRQTIEHGTRVSNYMIKNEGSFPVWKGPGNGY